ncbi:MAG: hypothetical protein ACR2NL_09990, partial [Acidimicrobiia bacterium]
MRRREGRVQIRSEVPSGVLGSYGLDRWSSALRASLFGIDPKRARLELVGEGTQMPLGHRVLVRVQVGDVLDRSPDSRLEIGALRVGDGEQASLAHVVGDSEQFRGLVFQIQVKGGEAAAKTSAA